MPTFESQASSSTGSKGIKRSRSPEELSRVQYHPSKLHHAFDGRTQPRPVQGNTVQSTLTDSSTPAPTPASGMASAGPTGSSFRNVSACNRCRLRKNRCDQRLPRCQSCEKAGVRCVGYDPITKQEIPRSYVYFLETRVSYLEKQLVNHGIDFKPAEAFIDDNGADPESPHAVQKKPGMASVSSPLNDSSRDNESQTGFEGQESKSRKHRRESVRPEHANEGDYEKDEERLDNLVSNSGMVSVEGASDPRYLGSTSGISFARVVFAAVKSTVNGNGSDRSSVRPSERPLASSGSGTMRDSFFGLQTRPLVKRAKFPDRELGERLARLYFEHANPQIPILHRGEFMELFNKVYATEEQNRSARDLYFLFIVFAIGAGIIFNTRGETETLREGHGHSSSGPTSKKQRLSSHQYQPEEYHAAAVVHLETFLGSSSFNGGLEELQAVLLLAGFALLRPIAPGLWYIVGVAVRLAVDLGLHYEDGSGIDAIGERETRRGSIKVKAEAKTQPKIDARDRGRFEWIRDFRRRLWWCVYSFDRLVSTCVGRPFGITDQVITTEFPSLLDDQYITKEGFEAPSGHPPSYKHVAHHYLKLRLLQSEIQQVLQYQQAHHARLSGKNRENVFMHTKLPSPFLQGFGSFRVWRQDILRRLAEWKNSAPNRRMTGVEFSVEFLELNYWQALIMLYRQSLTVPAQLANDLVSTEDVTSPSFSTLEEVEDEDEDDMYLKVAEAGQRVLRLYRRLHRVHLVNYTYLATHHLFMAGLSFLYAIWHSPAVRSRLTLDEVDFTVLAATSVLGDLIEKCPPAEACRDAFERMSRATVQMCLSTTGFGSSADASRSHLDAPIRGTASSTTSQSGVLRGANQQRREDYPQLNDLNHKRPPLRTQPQPESSRIQPKFDMNFDGLFKEQTTPPTHNQPSGSGWTNQTTPPGRPLVSFPSDDSMEGMTANMSYRSPQRGYGTPPNQAPQFPSDTSPMEFSPDSSLAQSYGYGQSLEQRSSLGLSGLDFLDFGLTGVPQTDDGSSSFDPQSYAQFGQATGSGAGLDLGFGMNVDFRDWSDGGGYDLFEGFFFGGSGNGANQG